VLLCGAQQDINIQLDNNNRPFLNTAVQSTAARTLLLSSIACNAQQHGRM
jgi:hypothetical protein